jgi:hypothetical protein
MYGIVLHDDVIFYMKFHARCIGMFISLNGTEHAYTVMTGLHMKI